MTIKLQDKTAVAKISCIYYGDINIIKRCKKTQFLLAKIDHSSLPRPRRRINGYVVIKYLNLSMGCRRGRGVGEVTPPHPLTQHIPISLIIRVHLYISRRPNCLFALVPFPSYSNFSYATYAIGQQPHYTT
jgi:hypothetical protein